MNCIAHLVLLIAATSILELEIVATRLETEIAHLDSEIRQPGQYTVEAEERREKFWDLLTGKADVGKHPDDDEDLFKIPIDVLDATLGCGIRASLMSLHPDIESESESLPAPNHIFVKKSDMYTREEYPGLHLYVYCDDLQDLTSDIIHPERGYIFNRENNIGLSMSIYQPGGDGSPGQFAGYIDQIAKCPSLKGNGIMHIADLLYQCLRHKTAMLGDDSKLECTGGGNFRLGFLRSMQSGESWYQKFGFEYDGEDPDSLREIQQDLHKATFAELQAAVYECGVAQLEYPYEHMNANVPAIKKKAILSQCFEHPDEHINANVSAILPQCFEKYEEEGLVNFKSERCKKGSAGHFAEWLIQKDCKNAEGIVRAALPLPCPSMAEKGKGSSLWAAAKLPRLGANMIKEYNYL